MTSQRFLMASEFGEHVHGQCRLMVIDVTKVSVLRRRVGRAASSVKVIGFLSAFYASFLLLLRGGVTGLAIGVAFGGLLIWCSSQISMRLRSGDVWAAVLVALWSLVWVILTVAYVAPLLLGNYKHVSGFILVVIVAVFVLPACMVTAGLVAFGSYYIGSMHGGSREGSILWTPWEGWGSKHPTFVNKRSLSVYFFLLLVPVPCFYLLAFWVGPAQITEKSADTATVLGSMLGSAIVNGFIVAILLLLAAIPYRRARRSALLPATELVKSNSRRMVLYLRSFHDDKLKMRARAANGRSILERVVRVTFEEVITDHLWRYGPAVSIGKPGDKLPPLGSARDYVSNEAWRQKAEEMMLSASMIVVVVGRTEGLAWELAKLFELNLLHKLILLFPPVPSLSINGTVAELPSRWNSLCEHAADIGLVLPRDVDLYRTKAIVFPAPRIVQVITSYGMDDWAYETVLDAAAAPIGLSGVSPHGQHGSRAQPKHSSLIVGTTKRECLKSALAASTLLIWLVVVLGLLWT